MKTMSRLDAWRDSGLISREQYNTIAPILTKDLFSIFIELNALLYLGVLSVIAGIGWMIQAHAASFGNAAILTCLTALLAACFSYCLSKSLPYTREQMESPNLAFDYVLYLGCLTFSLELTFIESQFHVLQGALNLYLLAAAALFFGLAYRFDNRFVLSLALSSLAAWFGVEISGFNRISDAALRVYAMAYGVFVVLLGSTMRGLGVKRHFFDTYIHVGVTVLFISFLSGVFPEDDAFLYLSALLIFSAASITGGLKFRRFAFVAYGILYGYIGVSTVLLRGQRFDAAPVLAYFVISGLAVILAITFLARQVGRES